MVSDEVLNEYEKVKFEKDAQMAALEASKHQFADFLRKNDIQIETNNTAHKHKIPFRLKWKKFMNKFKYIMG